MDLDKNEVEKLKAGDLSAYKTLIQRYKEKVRNLIYSMTNNTTITEDLSQEIFVKVYFSIEKFNFNSKFSTWLYQITMNKVRDYLRRKRLLSYFIPIDDNLKLEHNDYEIDISERNRIIREQIYKLPIKYREVIILRDIDELSYKEICDILKCSEKALKSRLFRAREKLRVSLLPYKKSLL